MIVDSSAVMAVLGAEPEAERIVPLVLRGPARMSVATWLEVGIVADARSARHGERLDRVLEALRIELVEVTAHHAAVARDAYRRYGRGSGSPARLKYGDCFSYALATVTGEALLFVGDDFPRTDVRPALV